MTMVAHEIKRNCIDLLSQRVLLCDLTASFPPNKVHSHRASVEKMADPAKKPESKPPVHQQAIDFALDVANGRHVLSKLIPPALYLADGLLCGLIIWKVPCT